MPLSDAGQTLPVMLLASCTVGGWVSGLLLVLPKAIVVILFGLVAGGVLVNTMLMELPRNQEREVFPFPGWFRRLCGAADHFQLIVTGTFREGRR